LIRLQKLLSQYGVCSRRKAEELIQSGKVTVNGAVAVLGQSADPLSDKICVNGAPLETAPDKLYIALNKPRGYLSAVSDDRERKTVIDLLTDVPGRVYPVGRLDLTSEGLLLLTNDGELTKRLTHPSYAIPKYYRVRVKLPKSGTLEAALLKLADITVIDGVRYLPPQVRVTERDTAAGTALLQMTLTEGKNREIRKLCEAVGLEVLRLNRVGEGNIKLDGLASGKWRELNASEVRELKKLCAM
jgi:23S rRNA pseudouridine2605 synthase